MSNSKEPPRFTYHISSWCALGRPLYDGPRCFQSHRPRVYFESTILSIPPQTQAQTYYPSPELALLSENFLGHEYMMHACRVEVYYDNIRPWSWSSAIVEDEAAGIPADAFEDVSFAATPRPSVREFPGSWIYDACMSCRTSTQVYDKIMSSFIANLNVTQ